MHLKIVARANPLIRGAVVVWRYLPGTRKLACKDAVESPPTQTSNPSDSSTHALAWGLQKLSSSLPTVNRTVFFSLGASRARWKPLSSRTRRRRCPRADGHRAGQFRFRNCGPYSPHRGKPEATHPPPASADLSPHAGLSCREGNGAAGFPAVHCLKLFHPGAAPPPGSSSWTPRER